jgi:hypothetical protein
MTREEFLSLPPGVALRILFDALDEDTAEAISKAEKPTVPRAPKYDYTIYRQEGVQYASETSLRSLIFWRDRAQASADGGGQWAAKDAKNAADLNRWIAYREFFPDTAWSGERNNEALVAAPPSDKPRTYPRTARGGGGGQQRRQQQKQEPPPDDYFGTGENSKSGGGGYSDADYGGGEEDIPF